jgi:hypothetical protein
MPPVEGFWLDPALWHLPGILLDIDSPPHEYLIAVVEQHYSHAGPIICIKRRPRRSKLHRHGIEHISQLLLLDLVGMHQQPNFRIAQQHY